MEWREYIQNILDKNDVIDSLIIEQNGEAQTISKLSKVSVLLLDELINDGSKKNIFVFPEILSIRYELLLAKVIHNIYDGRIKMSYDPHRFQKGQRLRYLDCTVEFDEIITENGIERIWFKLRDNTRYGVPIDDAPFFQVVNTKKLSRPQKYEEAKRKKSPQNEVLNTLKNYKTHLDSSIFFISEINKTVKWIKGTRIGGEALSDILYFQQCSGEGVTKNISSGQMMGKPAVIIASDLFSVVNFLSKEKSTPIQSVIVDVSQTSDIEKQSYAFDEIAKEDVPIFCITDTSHSFGDEYLLQQGYRKWFWDKTTLVPSLVMSEETKGKKQIENCMRQEQEFLLLDSEEPSISIQLMYKNRQEIEACPPDLSGIIEKLFALIFFSLRNTLPNNSYDSEYYRIKLKECIEEFEQERPFVNPEMYNDIKTVFDNLSTYFSSSYLNKKNEAIRNCLACENAKSLALILPENSDIQACQNYWNKYIATNLINKEIYVLSVREFNSFLSPVDLIIVPGWYGEKSMREIIYSYVAPKIEILAYPCEKNWKKIHEKRWKRNSSIENNKAIIKTLSNRAQIDFKDFVFTDSKNISPENEETDVLSEIEEIVLRNKYKKYTKNGIIINSKDIIFAKPISYVGGFIEFCTSNHKIITATDIIIHDSDTISLKKSNEIQIGDFVVIRESEKDIIKELADKILEKEDKSNARKLASLWKESLDLMAVFNDEKDIFEALKRNGCKREFATVKTWMNDDEMIQPRKKEDLLAIAHAANDQVLLEKIDDVVAAGDDVDGAHKSAGRVLSKRLKARIVDLIKGHENLDVLNIWDPLTMDCEEVGTVTILKVIDVGVDVPVERGNTNKLIRE